MFIYTVFLKEYAVKLEDGSLAFLKDNDTVTIANVYIKED